MADCVHGAFGETTADLHESFGPLAGPGSALGDGTEAGCGFGSAVRSPAAAP